MSAQLAEMSARLEKLSMIPVELPVSIREEVKSSLFSFSSSSSSSSSASPFSFASRATVNLPKLVKQEKIDLDYAPKEALSVPGPSHGSRKIVFEPAEFKGDLTDKLDEYQTRIELFLRFSGFLSEEDKLGLMISKFKPSAMKWFYHLKPSPTTVVELLQKILKEFGQHAQESAYARLSACKQTQGMTVLSYLESLMTIFGQLPALPEEQQLHHFVDGLLPPLRQKVKSAEGLLVAMGSPALTLAVAKKIAQKEEFDAQREIIDISQISQFQKVDQNDLEERIASVIQRQFQQNSWQNQNQRSVYFKGECHVCKKYGHKSRDCKSHIVCEKCKKNGHETKDCYLGQNKSIHKKWFKPVEKNNHNQGNA